MIALYLGILLAVALVCWQAGALWDARRQYKADMDRLDQWATETEQRMKETAA